MSQSQPLRIENPDVGSFGTVRCINSALWFVNNRALETRILTYLAKYQEKYQVTLYSFVMQGNHFHSNGQFPNCNRSLFYRDLNARTAEGVRELVPEFLGGPLFERRYSEQALPLDGDIEQQFFYCALQPVLSGLTEHPINYPAYNSFLDAINGIERRFKWVDRARYNAAKKKNPRVRIEDYTKTYTLKYSRLPGYEQYSQSEYKEIMLKKFEERRREAVAKRYAEGKGFLGPEAFKDVIPGSLPHSTKKSTRNSPRPLVLCSCPIAKKQYLDWYFAIYEAYKRAATLYRAGDRSANFPPRTYKPPGIILVG